MSKCRTCEYVLYDGMCLAEGKYTLLDAPACDDYKPRIDVEVSKLKAENAKLREMLAEDNEELAKMRRVIDYLYSFAKSCGVDAEDMRELGVEVDG